MFSDYRFYGGSYNDFCYHRPYHHQFSQLSCLFDSPVGIRVFALTCASFLFDDF